MRWHRSAANIRNDKLISKSCMFLLKIPAYLDPIIDSDFLKAPKTARMIAEEIARPYGVTIPPGRITAELTKRLFSLTSLPFTRNSWFYLPSGNGFYRLHFSSCGKRHWHNLPDINHNAKRPVRSTINWAWSTARRGLSRPIRFTVRNIALNWTWALPDRVTLNMPFPFPMVRWEPRCSPTRIRASGWPCSM